MGNSVSFFSTCPACRHARLQNGYTCAELAESLDTGHAIDAYCLMCDVVWPITAQERFLIATQLAASQQATAEFTSQAAADAVAPEC
jgi:hypothetical protein